LINFHYENLQNANSNAMKLYLIRCIDYFINLLKSIDNIPSDNGTDDENISVSKSAMDI